MDVHLNTHSQYTNTYKQMSKPIAHLLQKNEKQLRNWLEMVAAMNNAQDCK